MILRQNTIHATADHVQINATKSDFSVKIFAFILRAASRYMYFLKKKVNLSKYLLLIIF